MTFRSGERADDSLLTGRDDGLAARSEYVRLALEALKIVDRRNIWMVERGEDLRLAARSCHPLLIECTRLGQDLQRNITFQPHPARDRPSRPCRPRRWRQRFRTARDVCGTEGHSGCLETARIVANFGDVLEFSDLPEIGCR